MGLEVVEFIVLFLGVEVFLEFIGEECWIFRRWEFFGFGRGILGFFIR